jgi:hypothetical protein
MPPWSLLTRSLHQVTNNDAPSADSLYFLRFLVPASGALAPVLVPLAVLGRSPLLTPQLARRLRKSPTRRHQCSLRSRLSRSAQKPYECTGSSRHGVATVRCPHMRTMLTTIRRTSATSSIPAARPISGTLRVKYVSVSFLMAHRGALSTTSLSRP